MNSPSPTTPVSTPFNDYLKLSEAAKLLPGRPSAICLWRWCRHGLKTRTGEKVRLAHVRVGRNIMVTPQDCNEFFRRVAEGDAEHFDVADAQRPCHLAARPKASEAAAPSAGAQAAHKRLEAAGL